MGDDNSHDADDCRGVCPLSQKCLSFCQHTHAINLALYWFSLPINPQYCLLIFRLFTPRGLRPFFKRASQAHPILAHPAPLYGHGQATARPCVATATRYLSVNATIIARLCRSRPRTDRSPKRPEGSGNDDNRKTPEAQYVLSDKK
nr:hypothetical protein [Pandoravirus massiliensis]